MNTLKKKHHRQPSTNVRMGQREHANQPTCALVTCSLHENHLGMNLAINSWQIAQQGHLFVLGHPSPSPPVSAGFVGKRMIDGIWKS